MREKNYTITMILKIAQPNQRMNPFLNAYEIIHVAEIGIFIVKANTMENAKIKTIAANYNFTVIFNTVKTVIFLIVLQCCSD